MPGRRAEVGYRAPLGLAMPFGFRRLPLALPVLTGRAVPVELADELRRVRAGVIAERPFTLRPRGTTVCVEVVDRELEEEDEEGAGEYERGESGAEEIGGGEGDGVGRGEGEVGRWADS